MLTQRKHGKSLIKQVKSNYHKVVNLPIAIIKKLSKMPATEKTEKDKDKKQPKIRGCFNSTASPEVVQEGPCLRNQSQKQQQTTNTGLSNSLTTPTVTQSLPELSEPEPADDNSSLSNQAKEMEYKYIIRKEDFEKKSTSAKLDAVFVAVNKLHEMNDRVSKQLEPLQFAVFNKEEGILPQLESIANHAEDHETRFQALLRENIAIREELEVVKGIMDKQAKQIATLQTKQADQTARSMASNITIAGTEGDSPKGNALAAVTTFFEEEMQLDVEDEDIKIAHQIGIPQKGKNCPIVVKCSEKFKKTVFKNTNKLAGKSFSVNQQYPEIIAEQKREIRQQIKKRQNHEEGKDEAEKSTFVIRGNKLYINSELQRKKLTPPTVLQILSNDKDELAKMEKIKFQFVKTEPTKGSEFLAAACYANTMDEVRLAYRKLFKRHPNADHISAAYSVQREIGYQDDMESGSRFRLANVIQDHRIGNIAVFIIRFYGGENLGAARFSIMKEAASEVIERLTNASSLPHDEQD